MSPITQARRAGIARLDGGDRSGDEVDRLGRPVGLGRVADRPQRPFGHRDRIDQQTRIGGPERQRSERLGIVPRQREQRLAVRRGAHRRPSASGVRGPHASGGGSGRASDRRTSGAGLGRSSLERTRAVVERARCRRDERDVGGRIEVEGAREGRRRFRRTRASQGGEATRPPAGGCRTARVSPGLLSFQPPRLFLRHPAGPGGQIASNCAETVWLEQEKNQLSPRGLRGPSGSHQRTTTGISTSLTPRRHHASRCEQ